MKDVTILFLIQDDQILLALKKRGFGEGLYNGVGGKVEAGETIEEAVVREAQEEIGVTPVSPVKVAHITFANQQAQREKIQGHVFVATDWEGEPIESEEMAPEWFFMDMIPYQNMWAPDVHWLPLVLEGNHIKGEFAFNSDGDLVGQNVSVVEPGQFHET